MCHTQKSYVFPFPHNSHSSRTEGNPSLPPSLLLACSRNAVLPPPSPPPLILSFISGVLLFFLSFPWSFWPVVLLSQRLFSSLPATGALYPRLLFRSFSRRGNRLSLRRTCSHSLRTIERKRGRKRYFSQTARTSASAVNSRRPDRGENFTKYRSNASRASLGSGRSDHRIKRISYRLPIPSQAKPLHSAIAISRTYIFWILGPGFSIIFR